ncbi:hypothetical protein GPA27_06480 [Aromatoleum toluolicum]|uniref:Transmembrane protein n=1 Tax=Aromatoleum toluolicum TaxID=90060 RepID=A0ABX1NCR1_9RHOO|nr:hypothetical protein [Aromatoleum toluolicum]NMF97029.1 hypothetical protein [Aromatoleum toluolicum]
MDRQQKKRLAIVLAVISGLAGLWLSSDGYRYFYPMDYFGYCNLSEGRCHEVGLGSEAQKWDFVSGNGISISTFKGGRGFWGHRLRGDLVGTIVDQNTKKEQKIHLVGSAPTEHVRSSCRIDSWPRGAGGMFEFIINCDYFSAGPVYFKDQTIQKSMEDIFTSASELNDEFVSRQQIVTWVAFFVPSIAVILIWTFCAFLASIFRFVKYGRIKG